MFGLTLPFTRLALEAFTPLWLTCARAAFAGILGLGLLLITRPARPQRAELLPLGLVALGNVVGFPLFMSLALQQVPSSHGAVVSGLLPLATAACSTLLGYERPSMKFWLLTLLGSLVVVIFSLREGGGALHLADAYLFASMLLASLGYVAGARVTPRLGGLPTIAWALVVSLPISVSATWYLSSGPDTHVIADASWAAWTGFLYVSVFSMFLGFLFWFRGLAIGGITRIGQLQLLQPFIALIGGAWLLNEPLELATLGFACAVVYLVTLGRKAHIQSQS